MKQKLAKLWLEFLFWSGIRDYNEWCACCHKVPKSFEEDFSGPQTVCGGCGGDKYAGQHAPVEEAEEHEQAI